MKPNIISLILAGGIGSRFKTAQNKLIYDIMGKPMVSYALDCAKSFSKEVFIILGRHNRDSVLALNSSLKYMIQEEPLGTGDALSIFFNGLNQDYKENSLIMVLLGDVPLVKEHTLRLFADFFSDRNLSVAFISTKVPDPKGYGRVIRNSAGKPIAIQEEKALEKRHLLIDEVNTGIFLFKTSFLKKYIKELLPNIESRGEYYITDFVEIAEKQQEACDCYFVEDYRQFMGINTLHELSTARDHMKSRINRRLQLSGVDIIDPENTFIDLDTIIQNDVTIFPNNIIRGKSEIFRGAYIGPGNFIENSVIHEGAKILGYSFIKDSHIGRETAVGPFSHLRMNNIIAENVKIGNFVEMKNTRIEKCSKVPHLSYIGDADIGKGVNVGAGVITCNYDGVNKHKTIIKDSAFIGSDSQLVAPVTVGESSYIGSGSTIVSDVPDFSLAIARSRQTIKKDWVRNRKKE